MSSVVRSSLRPLLIHTLRLGLVLALALALRVAGERQQQTASVAGAALPLETVQAAVPEARSVGDPPAAGGMRAVLDEAGEPVAYAAQTSPEADHVKGYRGPSNVLLVMDGDREVVAASLIASRDTREHVEAILQSPEFFDQFVGMEFGGGGRRVDAVSGATLTSFAIAEAVAVRLGGSKPSLRFPEPLQLETARRWFEDAAELRTRERLEAEQVVLDEHGEPLGRLLRTGPLVDDVAGYQGPSEIVLALDPDGEVVGATLGKTYDNEPYVDYVRDERYFFWQLFEGKTLEELAAVDPRAEGIEGVSGATMTSVAVAETIAEAARRYEAAIEAAEAPRDADRWAGVQTTWKDLATFGFVALALGIGLTRLRSVRWLRVVWQVVLVVGFGLATGNLLSQALLTGWSEQGVAWRLAPGLAVVAGVALLVPPLSKRNVYCHHLCPHGALQQLVRGRLRWQWSPRGRTATALAAVPGILLALAYVLVITSVPVNLAWWEPFDAYLWPVAAWGSVVLAILSLAFAAIVPMGYCRFGCPTGRLLDYVRRTARSDRLSMRDYVAAALAVFGWVWVGV